MLIPKIILVLNYSQVHMKQTIQDFGRISEFGYSLTDQSDAWILDQSVSWVTVLLTNQSVCSKGINNWSH